MKGSLRTVLPFTAIGVAVLIAVLVLTLSFMDWNAFKGPVQRAVSAHFGRAVTIGGPLEVHLWSRTPQVTLSDLTIGGPPWESSRPVAKVRHVEIELELMPLLRGQLVLRRLELTDPDIYLHQEMSGRANWTFENEAPSGARAAPPPRVPALQSLVIKSGKLVLIDELRRLDAKGTLEAAETPAAGDAQPFHIEGKGTINHKPFRLTIAGGPLRTLTPQQPYPFALTIDAGDNHIQAHGRVLKPFDLGALELQVEARGRDLAELYYLTQITLPNSPPYDLRAHIARDGSHVALRQLAGSFGGSDLAGSVDIDASTKRPVVHADLVSRRLLLKDFVAVTGNEAQGTSLGASQVDAAGRPPTARRSASAAAPLFFPTAKLQAERLRAIDADVQFHADALDAGTVPFTQVNLHAQLEGGELRLAPLRFGMAQGQLAANVRLDANVSPPTVHAELRASDVQLSQFKGKQSAAPPVDGIVDARAVVDGRGDSVHEVMSSASGRFTAVIPSGDIRSALPELTGVDVAKGVGLLLKGPGDRAPIRCGVAQFALEDGTAHAQELVFDTQNVLITGSGRVYLGPEKLDLDIEGRPKQVRVARLRAPVEIRGELLRPSFRLETGHVLKQGAIATALGALLTPLAAVVAFVDPGLAKNQNCRQLLAQAEQPATGDPAPGEAPAARNQH